MIAALSYTTCEELNYIDLPNELKNMMNIKVNDPLEVYADDNTLILKKSINRCVLCNSSHETVKYKGRNICRHCIEELKSIQ